MKQTRPTPQTEVQRVTTALMERRERIAIAAMQGFCANSHPQLAGTGPDTIAELSVRQANELLKALYGIDLNDIEKKEE